MKKIIVAVGALALPMLAFAQGIGPNLANVGKFIDTIGRFISTLLPIVVALALLYFFWGLAQFILNGSGDDKARTEGKNRMIWGVVALFVMVSVWGLVGFIQNTFGISNTQSVNVPKVNGLPI